MQTILTATKVTSQSQTNFDLLLNLGVVQLISMLSIHSKDTFK